eukprot:6194887-Pleurochrysis_carterae.AAC.4
MSRKESPHRHSKVKSVDKSASQLAPYRKLGCVDNQHCRMIDECNVQAALLRWHQSSCGKPLSRDRRSAISQRDHLPPLPNEGTAQPAP